MNKERIPSLQKIIVLPIIVTALVILTIEVLASYALLLRLRITDSQAFTKTEPSYLSIINIPYKAGVKAGIFEGQYDYFTEWNPKPFSIPDPALGYRRKPGKFTATYSRRTPRSDEREYFRVNNTRLADGTRWTGDPGPDFDSTVYIFGDSCVGGLGVNDEQTFSYLLQQARKDLRIRLFGVGGYGMTQAYILFNQLRPQIKPGDIVILGYADFYDVRNVVAPSHLRGVEKWFHQKYRRPADKILLPKASVDDAEMIQISYIQQRCSANKNYCEQSDPPRSEMVRVTASLVNAIAARTEAKVFLLHFIGDKNNPVLSLLDDSVTKLSALPEDFDYLIWDDVEGFDPHPGPYWHYAISRKVLEALNSH